MKISIILFVIAFVIRSWHSSFSVESIGYPVLNRPPILRSDIALAIISIIPIPIAIASFILFWKSIDSIWYFKLPIQLFIFWFAFWQLPLTLFQTSLDDFEKSFEE